MRVRGRKDVHHPQIQIKNATQSDRRSRADASEIFRLSHRGALSYFHTSLFQSLAQLVDSYIPKTMTAGKIQSPVAPEEVYNVVAGATSQDPALVSASAARLKELLDMPGTFDCLSAIAAQRSVSTDIRRQAIIQFKNNALNHWRVRRYGISSLTIQERPS